jgi:long-chain acyl-CoA synthetase
MNLKTELTIPSYLKQSFDKYPNNPFLGFTDEKALTYLEVKQKINNTIANLEKCGIKPGDKVAILSNNMPNWGITYFAVTSMGAIAVPILPDFNSVEIQNIMEHSESKVMFVAEILASKITALQTEYLNSIIRINNFELIKSTVIDSYDTTITTNQEYEVNESDIAVIIYTSGTTGNSKGVMLSHKNLMFDAKQSGILQPIFENDKFLSFLPLSHAYENTLGLLLPMQNGASVYYLRKLPTPAILLPALEQVKPSIMLSVPLIIEKIYRNKIMPTINSKKITKVLYKIPATRKVLNAAAGRKLMKSFGGNIRFFGIGGAKLDSTVERFLLEAKFPYAIGYGLTETSPLIAGVNPKTVRLNSTGPAIDDIELKLIDINPTTGEGEVCVKGDMVMQGYYKDPEKTKEVFTEDGWFKTGDLATMDKDGFLFIKGRSKNVIVGSSGENIYPEEIESVINNFEFVLESLVVEEKGRLVAMVHLNMDELEAKYKNMKVELDVILEEIKRDMLVYINSKVNKFSFIKGITIQKTPFEKTPTQKIKRYKYKND